MKLPFGTRQDAFRFCAEELDRLGVLMVALGIQNPADCPPSEIKGQCKAAESRDDISEIWLRTLQEELVRPLDVYRADRLKNTLRHQASNLVEGIIIALVRSDELPNE